MQPILPGKFSLNSNLVIWGSMASRASEARRHCKWICPQQCTFIIMHVNHFMFHPMKAVLLSRVIANQSNRWLLKLHSKSGSGSQLGSQRLSGCQYGFLGNVMHSRYCMTACIAEGLRPFRAYFDNWTNLCKTCIKNLRYQNIISWNFWICQWKCQRLPYLPIGHYC